MRRSASWVLAAFLASSWLASCGFLQHAGPSGGRPVAAELTVCSSYVPDPNSEERACDEIAFRYVSAEPAQ